MQAKLTEIEYERIKIIMRVGTVEMKIYNNENYDHKDAEYIRSVKAKALRLAKELNSLDWNKQQIDAELLNKVENLEKLVKIKPNKPKCTK